MSIPAFPNWREILLEDKPAFDVALAANPPDLSTYTFTNLFAWRVPYHLEVCELSGLILVSRKTVGKRAYMEPLGVGDTKGTMLQVLEQDDEAAFQRLHKRVVDQFESEQGLAVEYDRDNSDYLYLSQDLIDLPGRRFDGKRNHITRFKQQCEYEFIEMTQTSVDECYRFAEYWCEERLCHTVDGLRREQCAVYEMLTNFNTLGIIGGEIKVSGDVVAFAMGEALNPDTFVVHIEKADSKLDGVYQIINNEFCSHSARGYTYVNREQDLGVPGLRKAKESYQPVRLVESYKLVRTR